MINGKYVYQCMVLFLFHQCMAPVQFLLLAAAAAADADATYTAQQVEGRGADHNHNRINKRM